MYFSINLVHLKQLKVDYSFLLETILTAGNLPKKILSNFGLLQMHQELQEQQQSKCISIQFSRDEALASFSPPPSLWIGGVDCELPNLYFETLTKARLDNSQWKQSYLFTKTLIGLKVLFCASFTISFPTPKWKSNLMWRPQNRK